VEAVLRQPEHPVQARLGLGDHRVVPVDEIG
jgi:hypothetical protein